MKKGLISTGIISIVAVVLFVALHRSASPANGGSSDANVIRYLPLGDSYTIGQSVNQADRWPNQLVAILASQGSRLQIVDNPAVTGYTTQDLINTELPLILELKPQFVTILIGVNDYVQQVPAAAFQQRLEYIVKTVQQQLPNPKNLVLITIPDFGKTPTGAQFGDPDQSAKGVAAFNTIISQVGAQYGVPVADIFPISQGVAADPSLIANDGLHPSGKEYALWTKVIDATLQANGLPAK